MALEHWLKLTLCAGLGPVTIARLIDKVGDAESACEASINALQSVNGISRNKAHKIAEQMKTLDAEVQDQLARAAAIDVQIISRDCPEYPLQLQEISDAPPVLFVRGKFEDRDLLGVAIVGSRRCSFYGREQAERFGGSLAGAGLTVMSGAARGIDSAAHRGAMSHPQGRTIAVLGCGVDVAYPPENENLIAQIANRGAVVSEYPMGTEPLASNFPRRNRIISGLSRGVLVIEADKRSGALITARLAGEDHGRAVMAIPGRVDNAMSIGPHQLIRDGATLVRDVADVLEALGPMSDAVHQPSPQTPDEPELFDTIDENSAKSATQKRRKTTSDAPAVTDARISALSDMQKHIVDKMDSHPASVDELVERTGLSAAEILRELTLLSLRGAVKRVEGQSYARA